MHSLIDKEIKTSSAHRRTANASGAPPLQREDDLIDTKHDESENKNNDKATTSNAGSIHGALSSAWMTFLPTDKDIGDMLATLGTGVDETIPTGIESQLNNISEDIANVTSMIDFERKKINDEIIMPRVRSLFVMKPASSTTTKDDTTEAGCLCNAMRLFNAVDGETPNDGTGRPIVDDSISSIETVKSWELHQQLVQ
jgi:hypothetical protein